MGALAASLARFDEDGTVTFVGGWSESGTLAFPIGSRLPVEGTGVLAAVRDTGEPQRIDRYEGRAGGDRGTVDELRLRVRHGSADQVRRAGLGRSRRGRTARRAVPGRIGAPAHGLRRARRPGARERRRLQEARRVTSQDRRGGRHRAPTAGAKPARRCAATARLARAPAAAGQGDPARETPRRRSRSSEADGRARSRRSTSCASSRAASTRTFSPTAAWEPRSSALAERAPVPVALTRIPDDRLPDSLEAAIYYFVAEAITNVAKYAHATQASVAVERSNGIATVVVSDDGVGGAAPGAPGRASSASPIASRRSAAGSMSKARPAAVRASRPRFPAADRRLQ